MARRHLAPDGVLVQWLQLYEFDVGLLASVMRALGEVFPDYVVYAADDNDLLVAAGPASVLSRTLGDVFREEGLRRELAAVEVRTIGDLDARRIGGRGILHPLFLSYPVPPNSDYRPYLDLNAARARFLESDATEFLELGGVHAPLLALLEPRPAPRPSTLAGAEYFGKMERMRRARYARDFLAGTMPEPTNIPYSLQKDLELVQLRLARCARPADFDSWVHAAFQVALATIPYLPAQQAQALWRRLDATPCRAALPDSQGRWLTLLRAVAERDVGTMVSSATELLANPSPSLESRKSREYLIAVGMAAYLAQGKDGEARALWDRYGPPVSADLGIELRLLYALAHPPQ